MAEDIYNKTETQIEIDQRVIPLEKKINATRETSNRVFTTTANAVTYFTTIGNEPDGLTYFEIPTSNAGAGIYIYDPVAETATFDRGFGLAEDDKSAVGVAPSENKLVTGGQVHIANDLLEKSLNKSTINLFDVRKKIKGFSVNGGGDIVSTGFAVFTSPKIILDQTKTHITISCKNGVLSSSNHYVFKKENGEKTGVNDLNGLSEMTIAIPTGSKYLEFSAPNTLTDIQVNYGESALPYEKFGGVELLSTTFVKSGNNLNNIAYKSKNKQFVDRITGNITPSSFDLYTSHYIQLDNQKLEENNRQITLSAFGGNEILNDTQGYRTLRNDGTASTFGAYNGTKTITISIPKDSNILQITISKALFDIMVNYGAVALPYESYKGNTDAFSDLAFLNDKGSGNLYNSHSYKLRKAFIRSSTGALESTTYDLNVIEKVLIDNSKSNLTLSVPYPNTMSSSQGWRFLDKDGTMVKFGGYNGTDRITIPIPSNAPIFEFTIGINRAGYKLEYGTEVTNNHTSIVPLYNNDERLTDWNDAVVLPKILYLTNGRKNFIYFNNIVRAPYIEGNDYRASNLSGINNYERFFSVMPTTTQTGLIDIKRLRSDSKGYRFIRNQQVEVVNKAIGKAPVILFAGDSFSEIGKFIQAIYDNLIDDGLTPELIGAMQTVNGTNARSENQTGGTLATHFMTALSSSKCYVVDATGVSVDKINQGFGQYVNVNDDNGVSWQVWGSKLSGGNGKIRLTRGGSGTLPTSGNLIFTTGLSGTFSYTNAVEVSKNPFWNISTSQLDFSAYFNLWGWNIPDILVIQFMWNDCGDFGAGVANLVSNTKIFVDAFLAEYPDTKIIFSVESMGGLIDNDGNEIKEGMKETAFQLTKQMEAAFETGYDGKFYIAPSYAFVDRINGHNFSEVVVNPLYPAQKLQTRSEFIHPNLGMYEIGDCITNVIHKISNSL